MRVAPPAAGVAVGVLAVAALGVWQGPRLLRHDNGDERAARAFAAAWPQGRLAALPWDVSSGPDPAGQVATITAPLTALPQDRPSTVTVTSVRRDGDQATARLHVRWELGVPWEYDTSLALLQKDGWRPVLTPAVIHPSLTAGQTLRSRVQPAPRAPITDRTGKALVTDRPVVTVGLQPNRAPELAASVARIAKLTGVDAAALLRRAQAAKPDGLVEVITLRREAYLRQRDQIRPVPGVVLREGLRQLAPTTGFARALLGTVGPATAEVVERSGGTVRPDQQVGLSGLQARFESQLAGSPGLVVEAVGGTGTRALQTTPATPGTPLQVTLDPRVQTAAEAALTKAPAGKSSALVVVQPSTGDVLAIANDGPDGPGRDRALTGRYPPGSTFKIASTLALLRDGLRPSEPVPCPATVTVQGKAFKNAEDEALGSAPFRTAFATSCNTAFVGSASRVSSDDLASAGRDLGYGTHDLGVGAFGGSVPTTTDPVQHAAQMIGQGKVLASPLSVAVSAASVASGRLRPPRLLMSAPATVPGPVLPQAADLRTLMRLVVTSGTGTALARLPGGPVSGKTGTAEFGTSVPPQTHAWFAGFSGDLAFAVLVEDGGFGGAVAAPLAGELLRALR